jgi:hypothetical protein
MVRLEINSKYTLLTVVSSDSDDVVETLPDTMDIDTPEASSPPPPSTTP